MILYRDLYIGDSLQSNKDKVIRKMKKGKVMVHLFCVTLPLGSHRILEIHPYFELLQPWYQKQNLRVIGIASSKEEAIILVEGIIGEIYQKTGNFDVAEYLKKKLDIKSERKEKGEL